MIDGLGSVARDPQGREVDRVRIGPLENAGQDGIGEIGTRCDGRPMPADQLGPHNRSPQELIGRDHDGFDPQLHREADERDHAHVMRQRQPTHHHVLVDIDVQAHPHRLGVRGEIPVADLHRLRYAGRSRGELAHRDIRVIGLLRLDRLSTAHRLHGADGHLRGRQVLKHHQEGFPDDNHVGTDHPDRPHGVVEPDRQVGAWCRLLQHRQRGAAHPDRLRQRGDIRGVGGQYRDRAMAANSLGGQASCHLLRLFVDFAPGQPHRIGDRADVQAVR